MKLSGSYQINLEKQKVWEALNDPEILQKTIPGCEDFKKNSETEFTATATNKIGPFNASFTGDIELKDLDPPNSYKITGSGNSIRSNVMTLFGSQSVSPVVTSLRPMAAAISPARTSLISSRSLACI